MASTKDYRDYILKITPGNGEFEMSEKEMNTPLGF